jgi:hypothetical protein
MPEDIEILPPTEVRLRDSIPTSFELELMEEGITLDEKPKQISEPKDDEFDYHLMME